MLERRTGSRALESLAARHLRITKAAAQRNAPAMRRAQWQAKAEAWDKEQEAARLADMETVSIWLARYGAARNALCD